MSYIYPYVAGSSDIWNYPNRTLTQAKFPFWSAIIVQTGGSLSVSASSIAVLDIQPASGETWLIFLDGLLDYVLGGLEVQYASYDGTTEIIQTARRTGGSYGYLKAEINVIRVITNTLWARLKFMNSSSGALTGRYGYAGFKLSEPKFIPKRAYDPPVWKRRPQILPAELQNIKDYVWEIYNHNVEDYRTAIVFEENTPLAYDPNTGFPIERYTVYAFYDDLKKILSLIASDPKKTGYNKYIDILKKAGLI